MALVPGAQGAIRIDDVQPPNNTASTSDPFLPMNANISGEETSMVSVASSSDWLAGTLGANLTVGAGGTLQLRRIDRDDFGGIGTPDTAVWETGDYASQGGGVLSLSSDSANGVLRPYVRMLASEGGYDLATVASLTAEASVSFNTVSAYVSTYGVGFWDDGGDFFGVLLADDGSGTGNMTIAFWSCVFDFSCSYGGVTLSDSIGATAQIRVTVTDGSTGAITADWFDGNAGSWTSLGSLNMDFSSFPGPWVVFSGNTEDLASGDDFTLDVDYIALSQPLYISSGTYESTPLDGGLYAGAYLSLANLTTDDGNMSGIGSLMWHTAPNATGPWSAYAPLPVNTPVDLWSNKWIQFTIRLQRAAGQSWPDSLAFSLAYKTEVGAYWLDDFPDAGTATINAGSWSVSSGALSGEGLSLDSASTSPSIGVTYRNGTWDLSKPHNVEGTVAVRVASGSSVSAGGAGDENVLLTGFLATDGTGQIGHIGVVRTSSGGTAYWGINPGGTAVFDVANAEMTDGQALIRFQLLDGTFHAWVLELENMWRGWLDLGAVPWGLSSGNASWRIGDIGSHPGSQQAVVDWAALLLKWMTPSTAPTYGAGNLAISENDNSRAVIAYNGPTWDMQRVTYRLDTVPPVGDFSVNNGTGFSKQLTVRLLLNATDRYGVAFYAASESLSFPEGWHAYTANPIDFVLSPGDGRKVVWVRFQDGSGVMSAPVSHDVFLDTVNPIGSLSINNRARSTNAQDVNLTITGVDTGTVDHAMVANDPAAACTAPSYLDCTLTNSSARSFNFTRVNGSLQEASTITVPWTLSAGDGDRTVYALIFDAHGRSSISGSATGTGPGLYTATIKVDTTAPSLTAALIGSRTFGGVTYVNSSHIQLDVTANDASGISSIQVSEDSTFSTNETFDQPGTLPYDLPEVSGARSLYVRAFDIYGLVSPTVQLSFFVDVNAPTGSIEIMYTGQSLADFLAGTAGCCNSTTIAKGRGVIVTVNAVDNVAVADVMFSTSLYFPGASWDPYVAGRSYRELSANDGPSKTIYVRFRDVNGRVSQAFFDTIAMDTTPPTGSIIINNGDTSTFDPLLSLQVEAHDNFPGDLEMRFSASPDFGNSTWVPFSDSAQFPAGTTNGNVTVYYQIRDANGWESITYSDTIRVRPPTCQELNNCVGTVPGFDGPFVVGALAAVAAVGLAARRRRAA